MSMTGIQTKKLIAARVYKLIEWTYAGRILIELINDQGTYMRPAVHS